MRLGRLIEVLKQYDQRRVVLHGFCHPHSWRGSYSELAFEPSDNVTIGAMLHDANSALGTTYTGYKGGAFEMDEWSNVYLANHGEEGEELGERLLAYMLAEKREDVHEPA